MDSLKSAAYLQREIGDELFAALVSSDNTEAVRKFAETLANALPTEMTLGGRVYDILGFLREEDKGSVAGSVMVARAAEMDASRGKEDCEYVLAHQAEIPEALRGKVAFVFPDWRLPACPESVAYVYWLGGRWVQDWSWLGDDWRGGGRLLRRK